MNTRALITKVKLKADSRGDAPSQIEVLRAGTWDTPWHGDFEITMVDLHEFAANFAKGIGLVADDPKAPINYAHESWEKAAGWITGLSVDDARQALTASVEWTPAGAQAIKDGEWSYISPEFNPRGLPWEDPEGGVDGIPVFINNVLTGAAVTNIPLFKKLKPIMASRVPQRKTKHADATPGDGDKQHNQGEPMELEAIRAKEVADLTSEESTFLSEHKADLTDDERTKFGLVDEPSEPVTPVTPTEPVAPAEPTTPTEPATEPTAEPVVPVQASAPTGVQITADRLAKLEADAEAGRKAMAQLEHDRVHIVAASVTAGQIKSDDKAGWVDVLLASSKDQQVKIQSLLASLPVNEHLGEELGGEGAAVSTDATQELHRKVVASIKEADAKGKVLAYSQARKDILTAEPELAQRVKEEEEDQ